MAVYNREKSADNKVKATKICLLSKKKIIASKLLSRQEK